MAPRCLPGDAVIDQGDFAREIHPLIIQETYCSANLRWQDITRKHLLGIIHSHAHLAFPIFVLFLLTALPYFTAHIINSSSQCHETIIKKKTATSCKRIYTTSPLLFCRHRVYRGPLHTGGRPLCRSKAGYPATTRSASHTCSCHACLRFHAFLLEHAATGAHGLFPARLGPGNVSAP